MQVVLFHIQCGQRRLAYVMSADERQRDHKLILHKTSCSLKWLCESIV